MSGPTGLHLRRAVASDAALLLEWANDPATRAASFHVERIQPDEHRRWLAGRLASATTVLWIGELDGRPIGQLRLELDPDGVAEVGISIAPAARGAGLGRRLLDAALSEAGRTLSLGAFVARVRPENARSLALFTAAGFVETGRETTVGADSLVLRKLAR